MWPFQNKPKEVEEPVKKKTAKEVFLEKTQKVCQEPVISIVEAIFDRPKTFKLYKEVSVEYKERVSMSATRELYQKKITTSTYTLVDTVTGITFIASNDDDLHFNQIHKNHKVIKSPFKITEAEIDKIGMAINLTRKGRAGRINKLKRERVLKLYQ